MQTIQTPKKQEAWVKVLAKGIITIPKSFREQLGLKEGEVAKAKLEGDKIIIESREAAEYRLYSRKKIDRMVKEDQLPEHVATETKKRSKAQVRKMMEELEKVAHKNSKILKGFDSLGALREIRYKGKW